MVDEPEHDEFECDPVEWARWGVWRPDPHTDGDGGEG